MKKGLKDRIIIVEAFVAVILAIVLALTYTSDKNNASKGDNKPVITGENGGSNTALNTPAAEEGDNMPAGPTDISGENRPEDITPAPETPTPEAGGEATPSPETTPSADRPAVEHVSTLNTGNLTEKGSGYEGTKGTGKYNYGEALQKAILFYELQRSGDLPEKVRCNWRGDSGLNDGKDAGIDLTGGLYDAGDNVKFNLPMAYTASVLSMSVYENKKAFVDSGQYKYILDTIKWVNDYLIKCHPEDHVYYYQVGDGNLDHGWWGPCEVMQMNRPSYKVTDSAPGSTVVAEAAASLAAASIVFKTENPEYSKLCLKHAKSLYEFAESTKSDAGYTAAEGFYHSWSGFKDELCFAGAWLYIATGDKTYLEKAESYWSDEANYKWTMCWDDVNTGACYLLAKLTGKDKYYTWMEKNLDYWTTGYGSEKITYSPKGLAILDQWGTLRYATTEAFIAGLYSKLDKVSSEKKDKYWKFAESQINYALGSSGRSFVVGFGKNAPENPHHRTAQGSYCDNMNEPKTQRHTLYGALVGGPDGSDGYSDIVSDYTKNEVACDYNAGFVGILSLMYDKYKGQTIKNFGAVEKITEDELTVEGCVNVKGDDFVEIRAFVYNKSAWPARAVNDAKFYYYIDLSEVYEAGGSAGDITLSTNYSQGGKATKLECINEAKHIYAVVVDFSGELIYPGGQSSYKKEVQFRIKTAKGRWNSENDPSFAELKGNNGSNTVLLGSVALYSGNTLSFGKEYK